MSLMHFRDKPVSHNIKSTSLIFCFDSSPQTQNLPVLSGPRMLAVHTFKSCALRDLASGLSQLIPRMLCQIGRSVPWSMPWAFCHFVNQCLQCGRVGSNAWFSTMFGWQQMHAGIKGFPLEHGNVM